MQLTGTDSDAPQWNRSASRLVRGDRSVIDRRYSAIFSVSTTTDGDVSAHFEAIAGNGEEVPSSAEAHIREFYETRSKDE